MLEGASPLLLTAASKMVDNPAAAAMSPTVAWMLSVCAIALLSLAVLHRERVRRFFLELEDPRTLGLFRVVFAFLVICNINDLWEHFVFLFTDEGILNASDAQELLAPKGFTGYDDGGSGGQPGFFGLLGFLQLFRDRSLSLLFFFDSPRFFWGYVITLELLLALWMIGLWTRVTGALAWLMLNGLYWRNTLPLEGTENVFRCFFFCMVFSRCGHAYSLDNWLRCRRLRRQGLLSEPGDQARGDGAGLPPSAAHPRGLEAVYRLIPVWPRRLLMLQLATIYSATGILKNGDIWRDGDALYYALNLDHFYRFYPQKMSALLGTNLFRLMTWVTHWWEVFFAVVLIGVALRWGRAQRFPPMDRRQRWLTRALWTTLIATAGAVVVYTLPAHMRPDSTWSTSQAQWTWAIGWAIGGAAVGYLAHRVTRRPFTLRLGGREFVLDAEWVSAWIFGRRLWLTLGVVFQLHLMILMNIGLFQAVMIAATLFFLSPREVSELLTRLGHRLARAPALGGLLARALPRAVVEGRSPLPAEDPALPRLRRDARPVPAWVLWLTLAVVVVVTGVYRHTDGVVSLRSFVFWLPAWFAAVIIVDALLHPARCEQPAPRMPWAYGPLGRVLVSSLIVGQITAVALWSVPEKNCTSSFREPMRRVLQPWLAGTATMQSWAMFAPNPPRRNVFLRVLVRDSEGVSWDLRSDVYAPEKKPIPWIWNDRMRKMHRRMSNRSNKFLRWYARYHCRKWALEHGGETPQDVEIYRVSYLIPTPEEVRRDGPYVPEDRLKTHGGEVRIARSVCASDIRGQLDNELRARHDLPLLPEDSIRRWKKERREKWERARALRARHRR